MGLPLGFLGMLNGVFSGCCRSIDLELGLGQISGLLKLEFIFMFWLLISRIGFNVGNKIW